MIQLSNKFTSKSIVLNLVTYWELNVLISQIFEISVICSTHDKYSSLILMFKWLNKMFKLVNRLYVQKIRKWMQFINSQFKSTDLKRWIKELMFYDLKQKYTVQRYF